MSSSSSETPNCDFSSLATAVALGSTTNFFSLLLGLALFGKLTSELYETANARRLSRDPSKTIIQGQVTSIKEIKGQEKSVKEVGRTVDEDSNNQLVYHITYEYIPMVWPQEADDDDNDKGPFSAAEVRVQRKFWSGRNGQYQAGQDMYKNGQYQAGQDIDVQILPRDPMSGRVAEELLYYMTDKCPKAFGFLILGLFAFGFITFGFWISLQDILQDGCRKNAVVFLFVAYVLCPGLLVLYLVCLCECRWKDLKWRLSGCTLTKWKKK